MKSRRERRRWGRQRSGGTIAVDEEEVDEGGSVGDDLEGVVVERAEHPLVLARLARVGDLPYNSGEYSSNE